MRKSKLNNTKTVVSGIRFDSKKEALRYQELKLMEKAGIIKDLKLQVKFVLMDGFKYKGKKIRDISYYADFVYCMTDNGKMIVEDVKGFKTEVYKIKYKLFLSRYGDKYDFIET